MTERMTPSEIADWLDRMSDEFTDLSTAAATIRAQAEALKIATEALKSAQFSLDALDHIPAEVCVMNAKLAYQNITQALARIKEVG